jgi:nucleotide-binding universal stress UspA family protein
MQSPTRILVPVDFSESSRAALEYAELLGARFCAEVDVLHVWPPSGEGGSKVEMLSEFVKSEAGRKMMEWLASFDVRGDVETRGRLAPGAPRDVPDTIMEIVASGDYDLVVMATHGHDGLLHMLKGSVVDKVVKHAPCPVVTVRAPPEPLPPDPPIPDPEFRSVWTWPS